MSFDSPHFPTRKGGTATKGAGTTGETDETCLQVLCATKKDMFYIASTYMFYIASHPCVTVRADPSLSIESKVSIGAQRLPVRFIRNAPAVSGWHDSGLSEVSVGAQRT